MLSCECKNVIVHRVQTHRTRHPSPFMTGEHSSQSIVNTQSEDVTLLLYTECHS